MWITKVSIQNPVFATMVMVALVVLGLFSYRGLGVESMPNVAVPVRRHRSELPGRLARSRWKTTSRARIEDAVNTVSGIKTIRANSWEGRAGVYVEFELSTNMDKAMQDLRDKVARCARASRRKPRTRSSSAPKATTSSPIVAASSLTSPPRRPARRCRP